MKDNILNFMVDMGIDDLADIGMLYQDYISESNEIIQEIDQCFYTLSPLDLKGKIHNLKGVSANLYVTPVFELAKRIDDYINNDQFAIKNEAQTYILWQALVSAYEDSKIGILTFFSEKGITLSA